MDTTNGQSEAGIFVRDVEKGDAARWAELYTGYRTFYELPHDADAVATTWGWVLRREHHMRSIVAVRSDGRVVGLANLRRFARPSHATFALYLDDLFTDPEARGLGAASALLDRAAEIAAAEGLEVVRWITASTNSTARRVYDAQATSTNFVTYDMQPHG